jgi:hypothetical protein
MVSSTYLAYNCFSSDYLRPHVKCRHANIPAFGGILRFFTPFPAIPRGIHEIPLLQMLRNVFNRPDNYSTCHLSLNMRYCVTSEHQQ